MRNNKWAYLAFNILYHLFSWGSVIIFALVKYGAFVASHKIVTLFGVAVVIGLAVSYSALKGSEENAIGLTRKILAAVRRLIPLMAALIIVLVLNQNIVGIVDLLVVGLIGNIVALPFDVLGYYSSKKYKSDMGVLELLNR